MESDELSTECAIENLEDIQDISQNYPNLEERDILLLEHPNDMFQNENYETYFKADGKRIKIDRLIKEINVSESSHEMNTTENNEYNNEVPEKQNNNDIESQNTLESENSQVDPGRQNKIDEMEQGVEEQGAEDQDEPVDDSDADPNYIAESESNDESEHGEEQIKIKPNKNQMKKSKTKETRAVRNERKLKRNLGLEYTTKKGKVVKERKCMELADCRLKCTTKVTEEERQTLFKEYWSMGNFNKRVAFIAGLIITQPKKSWRVKTVNPEKQKNRTMSYNFHLPLDGRKQRVCKACFMKTFGETNRFITDVLHNKNASVAGVTHDDLRGKSSPANKIPEEDIDLVRQHILSIPSYESHYCRKKSDKKYLPHYYTLSKIYDEYKKWIAPNKTPVSRFIYQTKFHELGIKIKSLNKDTCASCDKYNMLLKVNSNVPKKEEIRNNLEKHQREAEEAYEAKRQDKELALLPDSFKEVLTFDLQQCLPTPAIETSVAFYKRQLWTYNLTLYRCNDKKAFNFMWHEAVAARGGNQIASCLHKYLKQSSQHVKEITFYSDTCAGQNKNSFLCLMFMLAMKDLPYVQCIDHKFLVPGHTHMECDGVHSIIEKKKKKHPIPIDHPRDWANLVRLCGSKKKFQVIEMKRDDFFEFSALFKGLFQQRKINTDGEKVYWKDIKWLRYSQQPGVVEYKTSLDVHAPFKRINFLRKGTLWPKSIKVPLSYKSSNPITAEKKANLIELLPFVDETFHDFYKNLLTKEDLRNSLHDADSDEDESGDDEN